VTGEEQLYAYSVERVGADGLDQLEFRSNGKGYYTFYYDEDGNLTGVNKKDQYQYDENGQWIPEDQFTTINYRGEMVEQVLAKYTQDEHGNIIKFENHQYTEEITYTTRELTKSQAARTERFFNHRTLLGEYCMMPDYVFRNFYPDWQEGVTYMHYFMDLFKNLPW
jgi:hypothetical protein